MKRLALGLAASCLTVGLAAAQTSTTGTNTGTTGATTGTSTGTATGTGTSNGTGVGNALNSVLPSKDGKAAASGDNNQAVATTDANSSQPAHGSNSFTADQARGRIEDHGFSNVTDLKKDDAGVWRGRAQKGGQTVNVWLDFKGNVGQ